MKIGGAGILALLALVGMMAFMGKKNGGGGGETGTNTGLPATQTPVSPATQTPVSPAVAQVVDTSGLTFAPVENAAQPNAYQVTGAGGTYTIAYPAAGYQPPAGGWAGQSPAQLSERAAMWEEWQLLAAQGNPANLARMQEITRLTMW